MKQRTLKRKLETFLLSDDIDDAFEPAVVRAHRLGAYAYGKTEGKTKARYKADYLAAANAPPFGKGAASTPH